MTIPALFQESLKRHHENTAFHYFDSEWKTITYSEFGRAVSNIASYLSRDALIGKGERVAIIIENRPEWGIAYMGTVLAGSIAVPIDAQSSPEEIRNLLHNSGASFLFFSEKTSDRVPGWQRSMNVDSSSFREICRGEKKEFDIAVSDSDIASIIYTSGTTGRPKGVMLSHRNFCSDAMAALKAGLVNEKDNVLSILPLHHTYPFMCTLLVPLFIGASITYPPSLKGPEIISTIKDRGVTVLVGVPQVLEMIRTGILKRFDELPTPISMLLKVILGFSRLLRRKLDINIGKIVFRSVHRRLGPQFRFFTSGGARLDPSVFNDLESLGFTVLEGYGLSETSPIVTFNPIKRRKPGSAGKPLPSVEIKILNPSESGEGEIAVKGPMVMEGYYNAPEETATSFTDGWLRTGDLGYIDSEGYLFITGRLKEVIVLSSGKNVYPEDVEREYLSIPMIKEICIIGIEERGITDSLQAVVVPDFEYLRRERIANVQEALKWEINRVSMKLPPHMRIKGFIVYPGPLPKTALGKLKRYLIRDIYHSSRLVKKREGDERIESDEIGKRVAECIRSSLKAMDAEKSRIPVHLEDNLELDLGLDSLKRIELVVALENAFGLKLPETFASEVITVSDLILRIKEELSRGPKQAPESTLTERDLRKIGLYQGSFEKGIVFTLHCLLRLLLRLLFRLDVKGLDNLPDHPFIISPNHSSYLDGFIVAAALPYKTFSRIFFQGFQQYFRGRITSMFGRLAHVIPIDPDLFLSRALMLSSLLISKKYSLCIFPEGGRTFDGNIMEFKKGVGVLAIRNSVPVIPTFIEGSYRALPRGARFPRFSRIRIIFGNPLYPEEIDLTIKPEDIDEYQFFANRLREEVISLSNRKTEREE